MDNKKECFSLEYLRSLSTAQLEEIVRDDAANLDLCSDDKIFTVLSVLEERQKEKTPPEDVVAAWQQFNKYYNTPDGERQSLFECSYSGNPRRKRKKLGIIVRITAIAAILCLAMTIVTPVLGAENIFTLLAKWKDSLFSFLYQGDIRNDPAVDYQFSTGNPDLQHIYDAVIEMGIDAPIVPREIPEGFRLTALEKIQTRTENRLYAALTNREETIVLSVEITTSNNNGVFYIDEDSETEIIEIGDVTHYIMPNNEKWVAAWAADNIVCSISTERSREDLIAIIKSIYFP